jgi:hypothetical protein
LGRRNHHGGEDHLLHEEVAFHLLEKVRIHHFGLSYLLVALEVGHCFFGLSTCNPYL